MSGKSYAQAIGGGCYRTAAGRFMARRSTRRGGLKGTIHLGTFDTEAEARDAKKLADECAYGDKMSDYYAAKATANFDEFCRLSFTFNPDTGEIAKRLAQQAAHRLPSKHKNRAGYPVVSIRWRGKNKLMLCHRLAWFLVTGVWPVGIIDHVNGIRDDNRWRNLRHVTAIENNLNKAERTSHRNVIRFNGRYYPLIGEGFDCPHEAALVAETA